MTVELRGKNQIAKFQRVAERLVSRIASIEGVVGIIFLGGLVRGFADKFSDVDLTVFLRKKNQGLMKQISSIRLDEDKRYHVDIDMEVYYLEDFKKWKLSEPHGWELSRAKIVFDPEGEIAEVLREKLKSPKDFWVERIVTCAEYLKWYCCPPRKDVGTITEAWIDRGDLLAAHYCLNYAVDLLLKILFALNRGFLPAPKWRIFYSYELKWLPADYRELIGEAMCSKDLSVRELRRRLKTIQKIWYKILPKIEHETGLTVDKISKYYYETILGQT